MTCKCDGTKRVRCPYYIEDLVGEDECSMLPLAVSSSWMKPCPMGADVCHTLPCPNCDPPCETCGGTRRVSVVIPCECAAGDEGGGVQRTPVGDCFMRGFIPDSQECDGCRVRYECSGDREKFIELGKASLLAAERKRWKELRTTVEGWCLDPTEWIPPKHVLAEVDRLEGNDDTR